MFLAVCLLAFLAWSGEGERVIAGIVVDDEGHPLAGVEIAERWIFRKEGRQAKGPQVETDNQGAFRFVPAPVHDSFTLVAYSKDDELAGAVLVSGDDTGNLTIKMTPAVKVEMSVSTGEGGGRPEAVEVAWHARSSGAKKLQGPVIAHAVSWNGVLECVLPRGKYDWRVFDLDDVMRIGKADLTDKGRHVRLEVLLPPSFIARHLGQRLPEWTVTEARGVPLKASSLASFRGKWTLIEFWAYW